MTSEIEIVGWKCFAQRGRKGQYDFVGLMQYDHDHECNSERSSSECLNFTHRSTLGGSDDADQTSGKFEHLASE